MAINYLYFGILATMLILAGCVSQPTADETADHVDEVPHGDETPHDSEKVVENKSVDTMEAKEPSLTVSDQNYSDSITVDSVTFDQPGFVVIHADDNGTVGEVIGNSGLLNGTTTNLSVSVDSTKAAPAVHVMPHYDDNGDGVYGFPEDDAPVVVDGNVLVKVINWKDSGDAMENDDAMETNNSGDAMESGVTEITLTARQFEFDPSTITVKKGEAVKLTITSIDVTHGIAIPDFGVSETLTPGETTVIEFTPDKAGEFTFFCNVFCGSGHGAMRGTLIVTE